MHPALRKGKGPLFSTKKHLHFSLLYKKHPPFCTFTNLPFYFLPTGPMNSLMRWTLWTAAVTGHQQPSIVAVTSLTARMLSEGRCASCLKNWCLSLSELWACGDTVATSHIVESCPINKWTTVGFIVICTLLTTLLFSGWTYVSCTTTSTTGMLAMMQD